MRVAVLGGSRGCARELVLNGLAAPVPPSFTLLVRNPDTIEYTSEEKAKIKLVQGSAEDKMAVRQAVESADVVVFGIGSAMTMTLQMADPGVCSRCTRTLIEVVSELGKRPSRIVFITTTGAAVKDEIPLLLRPLYHLMLAKPFEDKLEMEQIIASSCPVDHVIVRPSLLTNGALTKTYRTASDCLVGYTISRADVGHFLFTQCLDQDTWLNKYVVITY
ncbi:hypothetical protein DM01DRAFT_1139833 [Hesseltinella vesiculosa]|uniref:NAD(P)-binding domain-containing protein n=1 Tax=Hesseltinella vesiculosa TaxID=101127 RepID=A0A1X2G822_9FUNG|nr:hypothetical protein DM01DRAFT_1139833 [Hesseltinella vesiculosa]